jgi:RNase H-fold protein (predicted Holliday junction resolvase)
MEAVTTMDEINLGADWEQSKRLVKHWYNMSEKAEAKVEDLKGLLNHIENAQVGDFVIYLPYKNKESNLALELTKYLKDSLKKRDELIKKLKETLESVNYSEFSGHNKEVNEALLEIKRFEDSK